MRGIEGKVVILGSRGKLYPTFNQTFNVIYLGDLVNYEWDGYYVFLKFLTPINNVS